MNKYNNRKALLTGHYDPKLGSLDDLEFERPKNSHCEYRIECPLDYNKKCFEDKESCRSHKFFKNYPQWREMGIGAKV